MDDFLTVLAAITSKNVDSITPGDIEFLKARKSYLTQEQLEKFAFVFGTQKKYTYKELQKLATERGIKAVGKKADELKRLLNIN